MRHDTKTGVQAAQKSTYLLDMPRTAPMVATQDIKGLLLMQ